MCITVRVQALDLYTCLLLETTYEKIQPGTRHAINQQLAGNPYLKYCTYFYGPTCELMKIIVGEISSCEYIFR